jgi:hypothetical protein
MGEVTTVTSAALNLAASGTVTRDIPLRGDVTDVTLRTRDKRDMSRSVTTVTVGVDIAACGTPRTVKQCRLRPAGLRWPLLALVTGS